MRSSTVLKQRLQAPGIVVAPGCYDGLSARLVAEAGFEAVYASGGVKYRREYFSSYPAQVMVLRFSADKPGSYTGAVGLTDMHKAKILARKNKLTAADPDEMVGMLLERMQETVPMQPDIVCLPETAPFVNLSSDQPDPFQQLPNAPARYARSSPSTSPSPLRSASGLTGSLPAALP